MPLFVRVIIPCPCRRANRATLEQHLSNLCSTPPATAQFPLPVCKEGRRKMINIPLIGVATALVVCALIAKAFAGEREKPSKSEKAEIMKQLLALSERENTVTGKASSLRTRAPLATQPQKRHRSL